MKIGARRFLLPASWLLVSLILMGMLVINSLAPGEAADRFESWPSNSKLTRHHERMTLLVFLHPKCACSHATLRELERIIPALKDRTDVTVVFTAPTQTISGWFKTSTVEYARQIRNTVVVLSEGPEEQNNFGAKTSGQTFLFDQAGKLLFSGGLTWARGHEGESAGQKIILDFVNGEISTSTVANVFGCGLKEKNRKIGMLQGASEPL